MKQTKVHWNDEEEYAFLYAYATLLLDRPNMSIGERVTEAMILAVGTGKLAPNRVRPFHNTGFLNPYREKLVQIREKVLRDRHNQHVAAAAAAAAKAMENPDQQVESFIKQVLGLLDDPRIQRKLREILVPQPIYETAQATQTKHARHDPLPKSAETPRQKRVLIVGLVGTQMDTIQRGYGHKFNLKFVDKDASRNLVKENAATADVSICMVRWVSHDVSNIMKSKAELNNRRYVVCPGHLQDLQRILAGIEA